MRPRVELLVSPVDVLWRVSASVGGRRAPQYARDFPTREEATTYAETLGNVMTLEGFEVVVTTRD